MPFDKSIPDLALPIWQEVDSIEINENFEGLIPTSLSSIIKCYPIYHKMGLKNSIAECWVRSSIFDRLIAAASFLPKNITLVVLDGWRSVLIQEQLYKTLVDFIKRDSKYSKLSQEEIENIARVKVSPPRTDDKEPSPHITGGSVDVTLCDEHGRLLEMGSLFDENIPASTSNFLETCAENDYTQERKNRRLLYKAMIKAGFTNLPSEWWHYDYGNQLWAYYSKTSKAIYSSTSPIGLDLLKPRV